MHGEKLVWLIVTVCLLFLPLVSRNSGPIYLTDDFGNPYNVHQFLLTLPDGRQFYVEEGKGLHWMRDRNGNRIDLLRDGSGKVMQLSSIPAGASSPARSVFFTRNADGQITSISDAKGAKVLYQQDENNDLVKVTDRTNTATRFVYDPLHNIVDIRDPRGVQAVRNEYDDDGRLIATIDAKGNRIEFDHDIAGRMETVLDRKGRQSVLHYDDYGNVTSTTRILDGRTITTSSEYGDPNNPDKPTKTTDALGKSTFYSYDANGSPTQITDPLGHTTQMTYDGTQVKTVTDAAGVVVTDNTYNAQGQLLTSKDALGNVTKYDYFPCGAPQRVTDAKNNITTYALDSSYNIASVTDAKGHQVAFNYDANGNKIKQTTNRTAADGSLQTLITSYVYDGDGRITQTTHPDGSVSYTTYNSIGKVEYTRDALFRVTSFDYDDLGQKIGTTYPDGTASATSYDVNGNVLTSTDRAGRTATYQYDDLDRQVKTILPDGNYTQQVYDDDGRVTESYDEKHHKTSYTYDEAGRQTHVKDALGNETITSYDDRDRQTMVEDAAGKFTNFHYDDDGRLLSTVFEDGTSTSSVYDELGRVIQQTDQKGRVKKFAFDELGRLVGVTQVMDASDSSQDLVTAYDYDEVGNNILQTDAKGNRTSFAYDNMGRLTGRKLPGGQVEAMSYNGIGQLIAKTDFAGHTTQYAYDQRGRLIQKKPDPTLGEATVSFSYPNELTKISTRGSIQNTYKYDAARGWLNSVQTPNGTINYSYDAAGNRTKVRITGKDDGNRETDYSYDELNRVSAVSRTGMGTLASYSYDAIGNVSQVTRANGVISTFGYDDLHRLTQVKHEKGTEVLSQFNYMLSADGKRNTLQEYVKYPVSQPVSSVNRTIFYGYDNAGRLNAEQRQSTSTLTAGGTIANTARTMWTYDKVGNRLTQVVSNYDGIGVPGDPGATGVLKSTFNTSYDYNNNDWLTTTTSVKDDGSGESTFTTNFEYNANGSQTAVTSNAGKPEEQRVPYFYDFEQKLTGIGNPTDTVKHAYAYDADGNRIAESNTAAGNTDGRNYLVDPNNSNAQIVEEYDGGSTLLAHYDWNDAELLREASWNTNTNAYDIHEPIADGHNNIRQLLDSSGSISDVYGFDTWGNQQENIGGSVNPYRYNSQRLDASGLYYLRARQYASGIGRFLSHDPVWGVPNDPITQHRYLYAGDDPVNMVDPSGHAFLANVIGAINIGLRLSAVTALPVSVIGYTLGLQSPANAPTSPNDTLYPPLSGPDTFKFVTTTEVSSVFGGVLLRGVLGRIEATYFRRYVVSAFEDGATIILPKESYERWIQGKGMIGYADGQMLVPKADADMAISASGGNPKELAEYLGTYFEKGDDLYRIDIGDISKYNPRPTEAGKAGANDLHRPGYPFETSGGLREIAVDPFPESAGIVTKIPRYR